MNKKTLIILTSIIILLLIIVIYFGVRLFSPELDNTNLNIQDGENPVPEHLQHQKK